MGETVSDTAFLYSGGVFTKLNDPQGDIHAYGINDAGQIVGEYYGANGRTSGFLKSGNTYIDIDVPGAYDTVAMGINDAGQIVGNYIDANGIDHGFLATPDVRFLATSAVPEPSTWAMMILGFLGLGFLAYRRRLQLGLGT
jgi:probable HAF family extracellular repeat protein